jgi:hypothetical protein
VPGWVLISVRVPTRPDGAVTFVIHEPTGWHPTPRSQLTLDPVTAEVVRWEPFAGQSLGRRLRSWVRPLRTGEAGGPAGQAIALVASGGGTVLVWTLVWRRFRSWRRRMGWSPLRSPAARPRSVSRLTLAATRRWASWGLLSFPFK